MKKAIAITIRRLARHPSFTLAAIATLAVGVGATTAVFSTVNATLLRPLPYPTSENVYTVRTVLVDGRWTSGRVTGAYIHGIIDGAPSVVRAAAVLNREDVVFGDDGRPRQILTHLVTEGFFELVGLPMEEGRAFRPEDYSANGPRMAVISDRIWSEMFGRDPSVVGRSLRLATGDATVVGIAPPELDVPTGTDVWFSFSVSPTAVAHNYEAFVRVRPGTTKEALDAELHAVMVGVRDVYPSAANGREFVTRPLVSAIVGDLGPVLVVVLAGAMVLLLLGCVNVAVLTLARGESLTRELAVRKAFGAGRGTILRYLLGESFVLASAGTVVGLGLAFVGVRLLLGFGASELPRLDSVPFDGRVLLFGAAVLVTATVLVGLLPALRLASPDIRNLMGGGARGTSASRSSHRILSALVVAEVALAITLVAGGGWLVRSYENLARTDPGFDADGALIFPAFLIGSRWAEQPPIIQGPDGPMIDPDAPPVDTPAMWLDALAERLGASGQVEAVGIASTMPLGTDWDGSYYVGVPGEDYDPDRQDTARVRGVDPAFFEAMGTRLLAGEMFGRQLEGPTAVVNEAFVRNYLSDRDPIGASFAWGFPSANFDNLYSVLGVVEDVRYLSLADPPEPTIYLPGQVARGTVVVATSMDDPAALIPTVRSVANQVDPTIPVEPRTLQSVLDAELLPQRLGLMLMVVFALVSLGLAGIGIYGIIGHTTAERSGEMALRMALGASPRRLVGLVMARGRTLSLIGVAVGLVTAYAAGRVAEGSLYQVSALDPMVLVAAAGAVFVLSLGAFLIPALKGARIAPAAALRSE